MPLCINNNKPPKWIKSSSWMTMILLLSGMYASLMWQLHQRQSYLVQNYPEDVFHFGENRNRTKAHAGLLKNRTRATSQKSNESGNKIGERSDLPTIFTYVEPLQDENGMSNHDWNNLIRLWERQWKLVGFEPVVLTRDNHTNLTKIALTHYDTLLQQLSSFNQVLFRKWLVLATQTLPTSIVVRYADVDVLPLRRPIVNEIADHCFSLFFQRHSEACKDSLILMEKVAPSLLAGTMGAWRTVTDHLLQSLQTHLQSQNTTQINNKQKEPIYWTDTLAILDVLSSKHGNTLQINNLVLSLDRIPLAFSSQDYIPEQQLTTMSMAKCPPSLPRWLNKKWALHVGPRHLPTFAQTLFYKELFGMSRASSLKDNTFNESLPAYVLPRDRVVLAETLLRTLQQIIHSRANCHNSPPPSS